MVNAVLRKLAVAGSVSVEPRQAYPAWMVERWTRFFGAEAADAICRHGLSEPGLSIRVDSPETEAELADAGVVLAPGQLLTAARAVLAGDVTATDAFREGRVRIQDEGSQLVAEITGEGTEILDACAAPGGKTLILAERNPRSRIVACEVNPQRYAALHKRLAHLGGRVECRQADAAALAENGVFDLVLVDVPCSGTGTLGRNPEIRHRLQPGEFARQAERQKAILISTLGAARTGARIIYSTCSLEPEENEQVVQAVLARSPQARLVSLKTRIATMRESAIRASDGEEKLAWSITEEGFLRLPPGVYGTDGFFIALIEKAP
jgi:16S rRNA (cytosine967-C5)-methyltransferase